MPERPYQIIGDAVPATPTPENDADDRNSKSSENDTDEEAENQAKKP